MGYAIQRFTARIRQRDLWLNYYIIYSTVHFTVNRERKARNIKDFLLTSSSVFDNWCRKFILVVYTGLYWPYVFVTSAVYTVRDKYWSCSWTLILHTRYCGPQSGNVTGATCRHVAQWVGRRDWRAADMGLNPCCGMSFSVFLSASQLSVQTLVRCLYSPRVQLLQTSYTNCHTRSKT